MNRDENHMVTTDFEEPAAINTEITEDELRQNEVDDGLVEAISDIARPDSGTRYTIAEWRSYLVGYRACAEDTLKVLGSTT